MICIVESLRVDEAMVLPQSHLKITVLPDPDGVEWPRMLLANQYLGHKALSGRGTRARPSFPRAISTGRLLAKLEVERDSNKIHCI